MVKAASRLKLFGRSGGYWLFWISAAYLVIGLVGVYNGVLSIWLSPLYIFFLAMPFWFPPLGRAINLDVTWDQKMFDWFKSREERTKDYNVIEFPKPVEVPRPKPEEHYRVGFTTDGGTTLTLLSNQGYGSMTLTMDRNSCEQLIRMLRATYTDEVVEE
jgi:hypothetical protein